MIEAKSEQEKYAKLYKSKYPPTGYSVDLAEFIVNTARRGDRLLDLGCGHGRAVIALRTLGYDCWGVDITLAGLPSTGTRGFVEAPLWTIPYKDNQFEYTFSTDVMEHIPPKMVEAVIKEIYRITRVETFHCVSTVDDPNYPNVHLTIEPIKWWRDQFSRLNLNQVDTHIVSPEEFLLLCHYVNKRRVG